MIRRNSEPCIAMLGDFLAQVPSRDIRADARILNVLWCHTMLGQNRHVDSVHATHTVILCSVRIAGHSLWLEIAFHFEDRPQYVVIDLVVLRSRDDATFDRPRKH